MEGFDGPHIDRRTFLASVGAGIGAGVGAGALVPKLAQAAESDAERLSLEGRGRLLLENGTPLTLSS